MRTLLAMLVTGGLLVAGCGHPKPYPPMRTTAFPGFPPGTAPERKLIVTPDTGLSGKIVSVNAEGRYAILNFPIGHLPALGQRLNVYRLGLKVGEIKITGPQMDDNVVGDLAAGEARKGDQVSDR